VASVNRAHRGVLAGAAGLALAAVASATLHAGVPNDARWRLLALIGALWALFALAAWLVLRTPARTAVPLIVAGGIALQLLALATPPRMTDDYYRYVWDGRVQAAGIDPYRYPPTAPQVAELRDEWLFPGGRPRLNHPDAPTIYPPVAQLYFAGLHYASPPGSRHKPAQVAAAALAAATILGLLWVLRRAGADQRLAVLWAWCPTVFLEAGNNAHVDVLGVLLVVLAFGALLHRRSGLAGSLAGAAVAVKLLPALVFPALLRRRPVALLGAAGAVLVLFYLPHVLAVGPKAVGFLPGYLSEGGYDGTGRRFALPGLILPPPADALAAVAILAGAAALAWRHADPRRPWRAGLLVTGVAFLLAVPNYPWYALLLVALVALDGRWEWLAVAAAAYPVYFAGALELPYLSVQRWSYGLALVIVAAVAIARTRTGLHPWSTKPRDQPRAPESSSLPPSLADF
jgi:Glycosyltransferase family 87